LRCRALEGDNIEHLREAVPSATHWRLAGLPELLSGQEAHTLLNSFRVGFRPIRVILGEIHWAGFGAPCRYRTGRPKSVPGWTSRWWHSAAVSIPRSPFALHLQRWMREPREEYLLDRGYGRANTLRESGTLHLRVLECVPTPTCAG
jgi:hypothetical protein